MNEGKVLHIAETYSERTNGAFYDTMLYFMQTNSGSYRATLEGMLPTDKFMQEVELYMEKNFELDEQETTEVLNRIYRAVFGLHVIEPLIEDPAISDIRINDWNNIRIVRSGSRMGTDIEFLSKRDLELFAERVALRNGVDLGKQSNSLSLFTDRKSSKNYYLSYCFWLHYNDCMWEGAVALA